MQPQALSPAASPFPPCAFSSCGLPPASRASQGQGQGQFAGARRPRRQLGLEEGFQGVDVPCHGLRVPAGLRTGRARRQGIELEDAGGIEEFKDGFTFYDAGGLEAIYNDDPEESYYIREDGVPIPLTSNVYLKPSTYTLGLTAEYRRILEIVYI